MKKRQKFLIALCVVLASPIVLYLIGLARRPARTDVVRSLAPGVTYSRKALSSPRPIQIHVIKMDLTQPGLKSTVTASDGKGEELETTARTATEFLKSSGANLAINASFFYPFRENNPLDYYPHSGDRVNSVGQTIHNGQAYSPHEATRSPLCLSPLAQILRDQPCPQDTQTAVSGNEVILMDGKPTDDRGADDRKNPYARVAVGTDRSGTTLWIVVIDGKQIGYSMGMTLDELAKLFQDLGADRALNLDGGGSSTIALQTSQGIELLNAPIHTHLPMTERPVANHLGFYFPKEAP
jgi:Phosphodiester glycosidase